MGLNLTCPKCGKRMTMNFETSQVFCQHCGHVREDEISRIDEAAASVKDKGRQPTVQLTHRGPIQPSAHAAFETGHDLLFEGKTAEALDAFRRAADLQEDFLDAHLWIAQVSDDEKTKRDHLGIVLGYDSMNPEAIRQLMVLNGRLTPEQAARTYHYNDPEVSQAEAVAARTTELLCPSCGGHLAINEAANQVECRFCGFTGPRPANQSVDMDNLLVALLERKAQPVQWNVGKRLVQCQQCGAEHTLTAEKMSARCRFCGSTQVVLSDALKSFEQPDGLLPFSVSVEAAQEAVQRQLESFGQRLASFFNTNRVKRSVTNGVYLPFWVFDVLAEVIRIRTLYGGPAISTTETTTDMDFKNDVPICAVTSPPFALTRHLGDFDLSGLVKYEPKWLAKYPAQMYSVDFDKASLEARAIVSEIMKRRHDRTVEHSTETSHGQQVENLRVMSRVQNMSFRLLLLPVWIATLIEEDDDIRLALVNGQSGKVALGKARKAPH